MKILTTEDILAKLEEQSGRQHCCTEINGMRYFYASDDEELILHGMEKTLNDDNREFIKVNSKPTRFFIVRLVKTAIIGVDFGTCNTTAAMREAYTLSINCQGTE